MNRRNILTIFLCFFYSIYSFASYPDEERFVVPKIQRGNLQFAYLNKNNIFSIIYNGSSFANIPTPANADSIYNFLYPYSYLTDGNNMTWPLTYIFKLTPNISAFVGDDVSDTTFLRISGMLHYGDFEPANPGNPVDIFTDRPFKSDEKLDNGKFIWWQYYLSPDDISQPDTTSNIYDDNSIPFLNSWDFGFNTDVSGNNYFQDVNILDDIVNFDSDHDNVYGIIGKENIVAFLDDYNPTAIANINLNHSESIPYYHPLYLQMQKYIYVSDEGKYNNIVILSYKLTNRSDKSWAGINEGPITLQGLQFSLFADIDIGENANDDKLYVDNATNTLYFFDNNGSDIFSYKDQNLGKKVYINGIPTYGIALTFLGMRKGFGDTDASSAQYFNEATSLRNLTTEGYLNGIENNNYGFFTTNNDTSNIEKKWLYYNTYFYPRTSFNGCYNDEVYHSGYDAWGAINVGSHTLAPMNEIRPIPKEDWIYPTATNLNDIIASDYRVDLEPGAYVVVSFALIGGKIHTDVNNYQDDFNTNNENSIINTINWVRKRYPLYQLWETPSSFWNNTSISNDDNGELPIILYPNPFNYMLTINMRDVKEKNNVLIKVFNVRGELVYKIENGNGQINWKPDTDISSGIYFFVIQIDKKRYTKKCLFIK